MVRRRAYASPVPHNVTHEVDNHDECLGEWQLLLDMYYRKSAAPVLILSQEASNQLASVVTGMTPCKFVLRATQTSAAGGKQTRLVISCVSVYKNT